jgi:hypothetical protein
MKAGADFQKKGHYQFAIKAHKSINNKKGKAGCKINFVLQKYGKIFLCEKTFF